MKRTKDQLVKEIKSLQATKEQLSKSLAKAYKRKSSSTGNYERLIREINLESIALKKELRALLGM